MDHILQLHVEHHSSSLKHCESDPGVVRLGKSADASRAVLAFAAIIASLALLFLLPFFSVGVGRPAWVLAAAGSLVTARTALFVLSNAILLLLAADCRWFFFSAAGAPASDGSGNVLDKQQGRRHHQEAAAQRLAAQPCAPYSAEHENSGTASEAFTEPAMASDSTTELESPEEQGGGPATTPELLGLDELGIDELNKKFEEFIQSRRNRWLKEEACLLAVTPGL